MKAMIYFLISIYLFKLALGQCYSENPGSVDTCKNKKRDGHRCCFVEYKNNRMSNYSRLCLEFVNDDIKSGHHEATIISIEEANYTGSNWNESIMEKFRDYCTINEFDCKSKYISNSLILISSLLIIFLIL